MNNALRPSPVPLVIEPGEPPRNLSVVERRAHPRIPMSAQVSGTSQSCFFTGVTEDLSEGGVFIATPNPPPVGASVVVRVQVEGLELSHIVEHGRVAWHRTGLNGEVTGCGVAFVDLDERSKAILSWMMAQLDRDPLYWDM